MSDKIQEIKKLTMQYPPSALYCPICNSKATTDDYAVNEVSNKVTISKHCSKCMATFDIVYNLVPLKIENLQTTIIYEDIPLN